MRTFGLQGNAKHLSTVQTIKSRLMAKSMIEAIDILTSERQSTACALKVAAGSIAIMIMEG
jgi:hypothetical protein